MVKKGLGYPRKVDGTTEFMQMYVKMSLGEQNSRELKELSLKCK